MDRCALFVDAGYLLADGAMAVHGTRHREAVSWDFGGLLQLLGNLARERTSLPMLRCYWYEATVEGRRAPEHEALADLPGLKLRLGRVRPGRREGVDTEIHRDLMALARNGALADAVVVSGDEDLAQVVADAQDLGVRVTVVHVAVDGNWTISRVLRQECDDLIEIGSGHLRPYVNLLTGMDGASGTGGSSTTPAPLANGHGNGHGGVGTGTLSPLHSSTHSSPPPSSPITSPPSHMSSAGLDGGSGLGSGMPSLGAGTPPSLGAGTGGLGSGGLGSAGLGSSVPGLGASASGLGSSPPGLGTGSLGSFGTSGLGSSSTSSSPSGIPSPLHAAPTPGPSATKAPTSPPPSTGPLYSSSPSPTTPPTAPPPSLPPTASQPHGPYTGPQQISPLPIPAQSAPSLSDAVKAAHQEGQDFGESVARDAPALWLEAVLARKPRMPSDLEARLLQGSSLPIDFLLHDEVRHALRRGFWDALERSRR
ncbi:NYN domain-containing protein [Actinomadura harenae]|uniref:NYN domain-containing protein n=1 Tax=Actinomadura harenae TaxID=2483351 RepID=A0A3M2LXA2_9ACTN|nr:NYN domain-containing protein [Actinomadura harenae]RMI41967.1 NYN domain-containing protein [Actinomadura harenae]